jgi:hypothetical protein
MMMNGPPDMGGGQEDDDDMGYWAYLAEDERDEAEG